jgi:hypothetical protein
MARDEVPPDEDAQLAALKEMQAQEVEGFPQDETGLPQVGWLYVGTSGIIREFDDEDELKQFVSEQRLQDGDVVYGFVTQVRAKALA